MIHDGQTIIACSSGGQANAAIAVIRLSGPFRPADFQCLFSSDVLAPAPRRMLFGRLLDGAETVDEVCYCFFLAPASYTGENVLELYVHGNVLNVERVIELFLRRPHVRAALPGEFSLRALQNRKLTLAQVEGLDLFLNASTPLALQQGMALLNGDLQRDYAALLDCYKLTKASLELLLDFHEDVGEEEARAALMTHGEQLHLSLASLARRVDGGSSRLLRPEIVIAGLPNAGKSTFFNALLEEERAIVSPVAGTTRDYLAEELKLGGVAYRLVDTAGVRTTVDAIEGTGIKLTLAKLERAFFSVLLINPLESDDGDLRKLLLHPFDWVIFTHADAPGFSETHQALLKEHVVLQGQRALNLHSDRLVLWGQLEGLVNKKYRDASLLSPLLVERHKALLLQAKSCSDVFKQKLCTDKDLGILSHELNGLGHCIHELLGIVSPDEVLDHIFANFCIGK